jgi:hypothetical protein
MYHFFEIHRYNDHFSIFPSHNSYLCNEVLCKLGFSRGLKILAAYERSEDFKASRASRAIRKAQFAQKRVAYKLLLFETTPKASKSV